MKKMSRFFAVVFSMILLVTLPLSNTSAYAEENMNYNQMAKDLIKAYDENVHNSNMVTKTEKEKVNSLLVNDMVEKQKVTTDFINKEIDKAAKNGEKLYSYDEILNLKASDIGIAEKDLKYIQKSIRSTVKEYEKLQKEFQKLGKADHPLAVSLNKSLDVKFPKQLIYVDHSNENTDGRISGGGWPYCLDDNGWGYKDFINSDCQWAYFWYGFCVLDQSGSGMGEYWLRYCKTNIRNCSPLIFHSKYWHEH